MFRITEICISIKKMEIPYREKGHLSNSGLVPFLLIVKFFHRHTFKILASTFNLIIIYTSLIIDSNREFG